MASPKVADKCKMSAGGPRGNERRARNPYFTRVWEDRAEHPAGVRISLPPPHGVRSKRRDAFIFLVIAGLEHHVCRVRRVRNHVATSSTMRPPLSKL